MVWELGAALYSMDEIGLNGCWRYQGVNTKPTHLIESLRFQAPINYGVTPTLYLAYIALRNSYQNLAGSITRNDVDALVEPSGVRTHGSN
jgi:hypothetical protein